MDKKKQIWYRFSNELEQLNIDCVDLLSKCYMMLGQRPDTQQVVMMAKFLVDDLSRFYGSMEMEEVAFAFEQGIRNSDSGGFINVRSWNQWLKEHKTKTQLQRQQKLVTDYQKHRDNVNQIGSTVNKAKQLKQ
jgi:hypothetical protein